MQYKFHRQICTWKIWRAGGLIFANEYMIILLEAFTACYAQLCARLAKKFRSPKKKKKKKKKSDLSTLFLKNLLL